LIVPHKVIPTTDDIETKRSAARAYGHRLARDLAREHGVARAAPIDPTATPDSGQEVYTCTCI